MARRTRAELSASRRRLQKARKSAKEKKEKKGMYLLLTEPKSSRLVALEGNKAIEEFAAKEGIDISKGETLTDRGWKASVGHDKAELIDLAQKVRSLGYSDDRASSNVDIPGGYYVAYNPETREIAAFNNFGSLGDFGQKEYKRTGVVPFVAGGWEYASGTKEEVADLVKSAVNDQNYKQMSGQRVGSDVSSPLKNVGGLSISELKSMSDKELAAAGYVRIPGFTRKDGSKVKSHIRKLR